MEQVLMNQVDWAGNAIKDLQWLDIFSDEIESFKMRNSVL